MAAIFTLLTMLFAKDAACGSSDAAADQGRVGDKSEA
jgi:hypothetical protein